MYTGAHGGDIYQEGREGVSDFSANTNPFGLPDAVKQEIIASAEGSDIYPDPFCRLLRVELAKFYQTEPGFILCGNGAADIIFRIAYGLKPKKALLCAPTFSEYQQALENIGCSCDYYFLRKEKGFVIEQDFLQHVETGQIIFICNPNNPTGLLTEPELMAKILKKAHEKNVVLVVDECFIELVREPQRHTLLPYIKDFPNLIILRAFTKLYAMAGLRLGYAFCSDPYRVEKIAQAGQPWSVSSIAQRCGIAALTCEDYVKRSKAVIEEQREYLWSALDKLGIFCVKGEANYILFRCEIPELDKKLLQKGFLIRSCGNYIGLDKSYYRIAVKKPEENQQLIDALATEVV